jgi:hypothetical protein
LAPAVDGKCRGAAPASTSSAVAYMNFRAHLFALDANVTAKAVAQCWLRLNPSIAAHECYPWRVMSVALSAYRISTACKSL